MREGRGRNDETEGKEASKQPSKEGRQEEGRRGTKVTERARRMDGK